MIKVLSDTLDFPAVETATPDGMLAIGGDLSPERLLLAYKSGIFPWFDENDPILWWSPDPRTVLFPHEIIVSRSMKQILKKKMFTVTFNIGFNRVVANCRHIERSGQRGTWITAEMEVAYRKLHEMGIAKSVEVWLDGELVGGLYGVDLGHIFCGESMFSKVSNASKVAFIALVEKLKAENYLLLDCQVYSEHLAWLGAREIGRAEFMKMLLR